MKRMLIIAAIGAAIVGGLTACDDNDMVGTQERYIKLDNGTTLHCVDYGRGGSCDWDHPVVAK